MRHPDEGTIHGWLDGALDAAEARRIEDHIALCEECSAVVAEARGLIAASSRILTALDGVPGGVIPEERGAGGCPPKVGGWERAGALRADGSGKRHEWGEWQPARWRAAAAVAILVAGAGATVVLGSRHVASRRAPVGTEFAYAEPAPILAEPVLVMAGELVMTEEMERRMEGDAVGSERSRTAARARAADVLAAAPRAAIPSEEKLTVASGLANARKDAVASKAAPLADSILARESRDASRVAEAEAAALVLTRQEAMMAKDAPPNAARRADGAYREERIRLRGVAARPLVGGNTPGQAIPTDDETRPRRLEGLRLLSRHVVEENGRTRLRSLYELGPGLIVTLDELAVPADSASWLAQDSLAVSGATDASARGKATGRPGAPVNVLRWTDERGVEFSLSGPIPIAELEELKKKLR